MTRSFYLLLGSLAAIGLVLLAQTVDCFGERGPP